ncbi:late secretory pathway protein avl9 [Tulasnella sp. 331]|nr:late secretory pathway protein avl9 [Tulasnella sp. 331]
MAHHELLSSLGLPPDAIRRDPDTFSLSSASTSSARSIPLDGTPPRASSPTSRYQPDEPSRSARESSTSEARNVYSPSTVASTEPVSATDVDTSTARTSASSQIFSLAHKEAQEEGPITANSHTVAASPSKSPQMKALADAMSDAIVEDSQVHSFEQERPPTLLHRASTTSSISSLGTKMRRDSLLKSGDGPLVLGIALIDFNHSVKQTLVGPRVEMAYPESLLLDEELCKVLPFLALPDGAHQSAEDYSYFHLTLDDPERDKSTTPHTDTAFGISCNKQIAVGELIEKDADVSRSTVQKAVVVIASKPLFGLIRDRLGVVTSALFNQRDFRDTHILVDFYSTLELSLKTQLTESGIYMGTNLRELIHKFRHRTLILAKLLILQKKIMFYGHPVERLCTYQYSLVSLMPNLLLALEDAASPNLDRRDQDTTRPTELKTSDRNSLLKYLGLPLNDAFFQPYLPLQQIDMLKSQSWLCGTTNTIVTQQRDSAPDLLINIELNTFEFKDPKLERLVALTPADRKWMDDMVRDVNESWNEKDPTRPLTMQFKGSDDYLRAKFEDYICSALSTVKYADYLIQTGSTDMGVVGATGDQNCIQNFGEAWIAAFRLTNAYAVWNKVTDPALFDICEARQAHPCESKPTPISDIGLRLAEGIYELKVAETVAPAREALSNAVAVGSTGFFKAFESVRSEVSNRLAARQSSSIAPSPNSSPKVLPLPETPTRRSPSPGPLRTSYPPAPSTQMAAPPSPVTTSGRGLRPLSLAPSATAAATVAASTASDLGATAGAAAKATLSSWGSFLAKKASEYKRPVASAPTATPLAAERIAVKTDTSSPVSPASGRGSRTPSMRSPPLGFKGALWTLGERAGTATSSAGAEKEP